MYASKLKREISKVTLKREDAPGGHANTPSALKEWTQTPSECTLWVWGSRSGPCRWGRGRGGAPRSGSPETRCEPPACERAATPRGSRTTQQDPETATASRCLCSLLTASLCVRVLGTRALSRQGMCSDHYQLLLLLLLLLPVFPGCASPEVNIQRSINIIVYSTSVIG